MIVDTSALIAILRAEADADRFSAALATGAKAKRISAANYLEAAIVIDGSRDPIASRRLDELLAKASISVEAVTPEQAQIARAAYRDFGRGSGHPAQLNFDDCFCLRPREDDRRTAPVQGRRLLPNRHGALCLS